jgi:hypothetical protein
MPTVTAFRTASPTTSALACAVSWKKNSEFPLRTAPPGRPRNPPPEPCGIEPLPAPSGRLFFHLRRHDGDVLPDEEGTECPDIEFAVREACSGAREILGNHPASTAGKLNLRCLKGMEKSFGP